MQKEYSFFKGLGKTLVNTALITLPIVIQLVPQQWLNLTLGGALYMIANYLKVKWASGAVQGV